MAFLTGMDLPTFVVFSTLFALQGPFIHSNTRVNLGWANRIVTDNRFHRVHHSIEERHFDTNFGERTTIWDQLFGTAYFPEPDEWPATGISGETEPEATREYLWRPVAIKRAQQTS